MTRIRHESSVTAISWIPSEAVEGLSKIPFELGVTHYDQPPPDQIDDIDARRVRVVAATIMRGGAKPKIRTLDAGDALTTQGEAATDVYLVLDGMFDVDVDGRVVAEIGPGAVVGERAALEGGLRTATLRAATRARVAAIAPDQLKSTELERLASGRREKVAEG